MARVRGPGRSTIARRASACRRSSRRPQRQRGGPAGADNDRPGGQPAVPGIPGAGDPDGGDAAGAEQRVQRVGHLCRARAAGDGEAQAGQRAGSITSRSRCTYSGRPAGQRHSARDLAAANLGGRQVGDLGRVKVTGAHEDDPPFRHGAQPEPGRDQFGPVAHQQPERQAAQVAAAPLSPASARHHARQTRQSRHRHRRAAARPPSPATWCNPPGEHHRADTAPGRIRYSSGPTSEYKAASLSHTSPPGSSAVTSLPGPQREVQLRQVLVKVVGDLR